MNGTFLYSSGFRLVADGAKCWQEGCRVESITLNGSELSDDKMYRVGMTRNCVSNTPRYFDLKIDEERQKVLSLSTFSDLARWCLRQEEKIPAPSKGRFELRNFEG